MVENLDDKRISDIIQEWGTALSKDKEINGYQIEQSAKALVNSYLLSMQKNNYTLDEDDNLLKRFYEIHRKLYFIRRNSGITQWDAGTVLSEYRHKRALSGIEAYSRCERIYSK